jgi:hypothetical protein
VWFEFVFVVWAVRVPQAIENAGSGSASAAEQSGGGAKKTPSSCVVCMNDFDDGEEVPLSSSSQFLCSRMRIEFGMHVPLTWLRSCCA